MARAVSSLLAAAWLAVLQGCAKLPEAGPSPVPPPSLREGYVVLGPLLSLHPLWSRARWLHEKALALQKGAETRAETFPESLWERPLVEPVALSLPIGPAPPVLSSPPAQLSENPALRRYRQSLEEALLWQRERIEAKYARLLQEARAAEETGLVKTEVELWQKAQVALNNLKIREAMGGLEGRQAREQREAIEARLQRQLATAREKAERRLAEFAEEIEQAKAREIAAAEEEFRSEAQPDVTAQVNTGAEDLATLQRALEMKWWKPPDMEAILPPELARVAGELVARERQAKARQHGGLVAARRLQARRLRSQADELQRLIRQDVEAAVRAIALAEGTVVHVLPLEPPAGKDMTRQYAEKLRSLWPQR